MKIHGPPQINRLDNVQRTENDRGGVASADGGASGSEAVVLSETAHFIQDLRETAGGLAVIRLAEVARAREDISSGLIDANAEIESAADGMLATI
jgi:hypothetical protein